ncbi:MAG: AMIN domain-containing protein [Synechococcaceae cyanobacterium SM2_3_60]|nr:AMIN domain-containing protein [Synechococcaceae cyanobacterium SM2_3_60]
MRRLRRQPSCKSWRYDPGRQRLEITTSGGVRPSLFVLSDPPRIVVDFPNTVWNQPERLEPYNSLVRAVRISQFNSQTSRLILDLAEPLSESAVELQTAGPELWAIQINASAAAAPQPTLTPLLPPSSAPQLLTPPSAPNSATTTSQAPQLLTPPPPSSAHARADAHTPPITPQCSNSDPDTTAAAQCWPSAPTVDTAPTRRSARSAFGARINQ